MWTVTHKQLSLRPERSLPPCATVYSRDERHELYLLHIITYFDVIIIFLMPLSVCFYIYDMIHFNVLTINTLSHCNET